VFAVVGQDNGCDFRAVWGHMHRGRNRPDWSYFRYRRARCVRDTANGDVAFWTTVTPLSESRTVPVTVLEVPAPAAPAAPRREQAPTGSGEHKLKGARELPETRLFLHCVCLFFVESGRAVSFQFGGDSRVGDLIEGA